MKGRLNNRAISARGHMPFVGHRTQKEVRQDEAQYERYVREMERELRR